MFWQEFGLAKTPRPRCHCLAATTKLLTARASVESAIPRVLGVPPVALMIACVGLGQTEEPASDVMRRVRRECGPRGRQHLHSDYPQRPSTPLHASRCAFRSLQAQIACQQNTRQPSPGSKDSTMTLVILAAAQERRPRLGCHGVARRNRARSARETTTWRA